MILKDRLQRALKQEKGIRLTAADVQGLASFLELDFPQKRKRTKKPDGLRPIASMPNYLTHVRWMIRRDMPDVLAIDAAVSKEPWNEETYIACLRQRSVIGMVVELYDEQTRTTSVVGSMVYQLFPNRILLRRLNVACEHQRKSLGRMMVQKLIGKLSEGRRQRISLAVDEENYATLAFFQAVGFSVAECADGKVVMRRRWNDDPQSVQQPNGSEANHDNDDDFDF